MAWTTKEYVTGLILFSAMIALFYIAVGDMSNTYNNEDIMDDSFSDNYDTLSENAAMVEDMRESSSNKSGLNIIGTAEILITSTFSIIDLVFGSINTFSDQVYSIGEDMGVPSAVSNIIGAIFIMIITVGIVLIIINAVNKTEKL